MRPDGMRPTSFGTTNKVRVQKKNLDLEYWASALRKEKRSMRLSSLLDNDSVSHGSGGIHRCRSQQGFQLRPFEGFLFDQLVNDGFELITMFLKHVAHALILPIHQGADLIVDRLCRPFAVVPFLWDEGH